MTPLGKGAGTDSKPPSAIRPRPPLASHTWRAPAMSPESASRQRISIVSPAVTGTPALRNVARKSSVRGTDSAASREIALKNPCRHDGRSASRATTAATPPGAM